MPEELRREVVATCCRGASKQPPTRRSAPFDSGAQARPRRGRAAGCRYHAQESHPGRLRRPRSRERALPSTRPGGAAGGQRAPGVQGRCPRRWRLRGPGTGWGRRPTCTGSVGEPGRTAPPGVRREAARRRRCREMGGLAVRLGSIRLALEHALNGVWTRRYAELVDANKRTQLLALAVVAEEADHQKATQLWSRSAAQGHHHHYELAPTAAELRIWLGEVRASPSSWTTLPPPH